MHPDKQDYASLYKLYKETFAFDDGGSIDDYFKRNFQSEYCYILKEDQQLSAMLCAHPHTMHLYGKQLPVRFISGVITREEMRGKGYMKQLFHDLICDTKDHTALYVLQAYHPEIYHSLEFSERYFIKMDSWTSPSSSYHLQEIASPIALSECAQANLRNAEGWLDHDEAFYTNQLSEAATQKQKILGYIKKQKLLAFARLSIEQDQVMVEELHARTKQDQDDFLAQLRNRWNKVTYPQPCTKDEPNCSCNLLVKLGNKDLCTSILNQTISTLDDIYKKDQPYTHYGWW